jgi:hypothetical protein
MMLSTLKARPIARLGRLVVTSNAVSSNTAAQPRIDGSQNWTSASPRHYASPGNSGFPVGGIPVGGFPSFFQNKPPLPMNTVIRFVPQQTAWIVERMGKFHRILEPGLAILIPFLDRIAYVKSLKENAIEIPSQSCITADNVTLELDGVLYTRIMDAYKARLVNGMRKESAEY